MNLIFTKGTKYFWVEGDDSTTEVFPQLAQISLKVLKLHLWGLKKILGLRQRVDTCLFASILVKHNMFMHKNHTWMSKSIPLKRERASAVYTVCSEWDGNVFRDLRILICTANRKATAETVADKAQWASAEGELQFSPSELLRRHYEWESLFMQVDFGTKFFTEFSSSGEPNYLH